MKYYICLDTCTWIYLANGQEPVKFLDDLENLIELNVVQIILPAIVRQEWNRNKLNAGSHLAKSFLQIKNEIRNLSTILDKIETKPLFTFLSDDDPIDAKTELTDISNKIKTHKELLLAKVENNIVKIEHIFSNTSTINVSHSDAVILQAGDIALNKKAPIHKKNGFADAVILLTFIDYVKSKSLLNSFFISYNTSDFCKTEKKKHFLHPDLEPIFATVNSRFFDILGKALQEIDPKLVEDATIREIEKSIDYSCEYYCEECDGNHGLGHEIDFSEPFEIINENNYRYTFNEPSLFDEGEIDDIVIPKFPNTIQIGYCNHCSTQYIKCQDCDELLNLGDGFDIIYGFTEDVFKCSCGIKYKREAEFDRKGIESETWTIIDNRTDVCEYCGEEFINKNETILCDKCEIECNNK